MKRTMISRLVFFLVTAATIGTASLVFYVGDEVRVLRHRLAVTEARIAKDREALRVLASDWNYFNRPAKLAGLARRHLALVPINARRIIRFEDLPPRGPIRTGAAQ